MESDGEAIPVEAGSGLSVLKLLSPLLFSSAMTTSERAELPPKWSIERLSECSANAEA